MKRTTGLLLMTVLGFLSVQGQEMPTTRQQEPFKANYALAAKFSPERQKKMIFSTHVSPHWLQKGDQFWYQFSTSRGKKWYLVNAAAGTKRPLFDEQKVIAKVSEIVEEPYTAQHFPIDSVEFLENEHAIRFQIKSQKDVVDKDTGNVKKDKGNEGDKKKDHTSAAEKSQKKSIIFAMI